MNKAEMVKIMWDFIQEVECDYDYYMTPDDTAKLLEKMLEAGMRPPSLPSEYCQAIQSVYVFPDFNQWEEDVQKDEKVMEAKSRKEAFDSLSVEEKRERRKAAIERLNKR